MGNEKRTIYSKRFARTRVDEICNSEYEHQGRSNKRMMPSVQELFRFLEEESEYHEKPERVEQAARYIELAKKLSIDYEIDMDITQEFAFIMVDIHLYCGHYTGAIKRRLAELIDMSDDISFFILKTEPSDLTISLTYYTHEHYLAGKKIGG